MPSRFPFTRAAAVASAAVAVATCSDTPTRTVAPNDAPAARNAAPSAVAAANAAGASVAVTVQVPASMRSSPFNVTRTLNLPPDFTVRVYARIGGARFLASAPNGDLLVSNPGAGKVYRVQPNASGDGVVSDWVTGLKNPHDVVFHTLGGVTYVYVAESDKIGRYVYNANGTAGTRQVLINGLPDNSSGALQGRYGHQLKNIALDGNRLFVSIASPSNADPADLARTPKGGAVYLYDALGGGQRLFAQGLRNAEGLAIAPGTNTLWVAVNNRDNIAYPFHQDYNGDGSDDYGKVMQSYVDNHPPEEFTSVRDGGHYGWPLCNPNPDTSNGFDNMPFDRDVQNNASGSALDCNTADRITKGIQAHSAPLGLTFWTAANAPAAYAGGAVIALHGSWNRSVATGYKLAYFPWLGSGPGAQVDLVTGWLTGGTWGRPVDVAVAADGGLFVSDDYSGTIYKLTYAPAPPPPPPPSTVTGLLAAGGGNKCLAALGSTSNPRAGLALPLCATGAAAQTWTFPSSGGTGTVKAVGICLTASGSTDGSSVNTDTCGTNVPAQQWAYSAIGEIRTAGGMCLIYSGRFGAILRTCNGTSLDHRWTVR